MDMQTESIFNAKELRTLRITCARKTGIVFDLSNEQANLPRCCPSCLTPFDREVLDAITRYRQVYLTATKTEQVTFSFQVSDLIS
jgi:hypothetical protein